VRRFVQFSFQTKQRKDTYSGVREATRLRSLPGIHPVSNLWSEAVREYVKGAGQQAGSDSRFFNNITKDQFGNIVNKGTTDEWVIVPELSQADLTPIAEAVREKMPFLLAENDVEISEPIPELGIQDTKTLADWMVDFFQSGIEVVSERKPAVKDPKQISPEVAPNGEPWRALIAEVQMWGQSPRGLTSGGQNGGGFGPLPGGRDVGARAAGIGNSTFIIGSAALAASIIIIGAST